MNMKLKYPLNIRKWTQHPNTPAPKTQTRYNNYRRPVTCIDVANHKHKNTQETTGGQEAVSTVHFNNNFAIFKRNAPKFSGT